MTYLFFPVVERDSPVICYYNLNYDNTCMMIYMIYLLFLQ